MPSFWEIYTAFSLSFAVLMCIRILPDINKNILDKRGTRFIKIHSVVFFTISAVFMPIMSLIILSEPETFIKAYSGSINEDE